jgi:hypothetical protein
MIDLKWNIVSDLRFRGCLLFEFNLKIFKAGDNMGKKIQVTVANNTGHDISIYGPGHYGKALVIKKGAKMTTSYSGREWSFHIPMPAGKYSGLLNIKKTLYSGNFLLDDWGMYKPDGKKCGVWKFTIGLAGANYIAKP